MVGGMIHYNAAMVGVRVTMCKEAYGTSATLSSTRTAGRSRCSLTVDNTKFIVVLVAIQRSSPKGVERCGVNTAAIYILYQYRYRITFAVLAVSNEHAV